MAEKKKAINVKVTFGKKNVKRKFIHSKKKSSKNKNSKNYKKKYAGQGR